MFEVIDVVAWLKGNEGLLTALVSIATLGGVIIATVVYVWKTLKKWFARGELTGTSALTLTAEGFLDWQNKLKADLEEKLQAASAADKEQLRARIAELESQIADPESALEAAQERIADLEQRLARMGNDIGGDRLAQAHEALKKFDYSVADDIFAEIEERQKLEVQQAARAAFGRGEIAEAEVRWRDAADHYERAARLDPNYETLIKAGEFLWRAGRHKEATKYEQELVSYAKENYGEEDPKTAIAINNLAASYRANGTYDEAELLYREALEIGRKTIGEGHPDHAARLNNLATLLGVTGRYEEAEPLFHGALEIDRKTIGKGHPDYAMHLNNLARLLHATGRYDEAERALREALSIFETTLGAEHPSTIGAAENLKIFLADRPKP